MKFTAKMCSFSSFLAFGTFHLVSILGLPGNDDVLELPLIAVVPGDIDERALNVGTLVGCQDECHLHPATMLRRRGGAGPTIWCFAQFGDLHEDVATNSLVIVTKIMRAWRNTNRDRKSTRLNS